jgi:hypothetical protein
MSKDSKKHTTLLNVSSGSGPDSKCSSAFTERSRHVFASIDELGKLKPESSLYQGKLSPGSQSLDTSRNAKRETEDFRNRESIFKLSEREESGWPPSNKDRPSRDQWERGRDQDADFGHKPNRQAFKRPFNRQKLPDYAKNPTKYTKYTLSDVPNINDRSNTQAALAFLREIDERKEEERNLSEEGATGEHKIMFKRPKCNAKDETKAPLPNLDNIPGGTSRRMLPEVAVGRSSSFKTSTSNRKLLENESGEKPARHSEAGQTKAKKKTDKNAIKHKILKYV